MDRLGRYQILEPIGSGPCGAVVRAKVYGVVGVDRQFALKQILPALTVHPPYAQALSAAARAYGSLEHPRIARLAEFTVSQGKTFTATELVTGLDVGRVVAESRVSGSALPPGGALTLLSAAARAVGYAHGRGLLHLGLCPQNLIISADGDIKVTDFGILAACLPERPVQELRLAHRVAYLAPEQLVGEPTSAATDVFALGAIAIEMVTGTPAFRGETPLDVQHAVLSGQLNDPSLPRPLVRVLQRCLARAPFERFPDARAFADALDAALRSAPVPGVRQDIAERVKAIMAHLAALNEGGLSGMVSLPSSMPSPTRPPTSLSPEVITTPISLPDNDRLETSELSREDAYDRQLTNEVAEDAIAAETHSEGSGEEAELLDEEIDEDDLVPHTVVQAVPDRSSRSQRATDAPMLAATLRGLSAANPPRPMPPAAPPPPPAKARTATPRFAVVDPTATATATTIDAAPARSPSDAAGGRESSPRLPPVAKLAPAPPLMPGAAASSSPPPPLGRRPNAVQIPARPGGAEEVTREMRVGRAIHAAAGGPAGAGEPSREGRVDSGVEETTARHRAEGGEGAEPKNAWDEAMESFEQPTRLNESLTASLIPSTSRTGPTPLLELDEIVLASLSDPLPRPAPERGAAPVAAPAVAAPVRGSNPSLTSQAYASVYPSTAGLFDRVQGAAEEDSPVAARGSDAGYPVDEAEDSAAGGEDARAAARGLHGTHEGLGSMGGATSNGHDPAAPDAEIPAVPSGPSTAQVRQAAIRPPGDGSSPWPNGATGSSGLVKVVEGDQLEEVRRSHPGRASDAGPMDPPVTHSVPALRPSDRSIPRPPEWSPERASSPALPGPPQRGSSEGFGRLSTGSFGRVDPFPSPTGIPPLPMAFPPETVPRLSGGGMRWVWMLLGLVIVAGSALAAYAVFGGFSDRGTLAQPDAALALPTQGDRGAADAGGDAGASTVVAAQDAAAADAQVAGDAAPTTPTAPTTPGDAQVAAADAAPAGGDAGASGTAPAPAATVAPTQEGGDALSIVSTPSGARVYVDGADQGKTPLRLPGPPDRHTVVLFLAGYELVTLEVEKNGTYNAELKEVTPLGGPAGIKVRCKMKDRYYVYVDGKPSGALCPTERLEVERGEHVIEIYDLVSETRRQFRVNAKDTSRSTRVRVD